MFNNNLLSVYCSLLNKGGPKIFWIEQYLGYKREAPILVDDLMNEPETYAALFSDNGREQMETLFLHLMKRMKNCPFENCRDFLEALSFLQEIAATALWKYHLNIGQKMETFVREFDRIDIVSEKLRLYKSAQEQ